MVAVSLASGNAMFRDKLRQKLEASGGVACKIHIGSHKRNAAQPRVFHCSYFGAYSCSTAQVDTGEDREDRIDPNCEG